MKSAKITITMNGETQSGIGKAEFRGNLAKVSCDFSGQTLLAFGKTGGTLSRTGEIAFSLPLGNPTPQTVDMKTAFGNVPAAVRTTKYSACVTNTQATLAATYLLSDGYGEQTFDLTLNATLRLEEV